MADMLSYMKGLRPAGKVGAAFGFLWMERRGGQADLGSHAGNEYQSGERWGPGQVYSQKDDLASASNWDAQVARAALETRSRRIAGRTQRA